MKDLYKSFVSEYPIVSIEDPFDQDDWEHYAKMTAECGEEVQIVGDDLLVTNPTVRFLPHHLHLFSFYKNSLLNVNQMFVIYRELRRQLMRRHAMPFFLRYIYMSLISY